MNDIANNIKDLRKRKGLSQEQMAELIHVTRQTVSAWERGVAQPGLDTLEHIAQALGTEPEELLYSRKTGQKAPAYRGVSFWPVLGIVPLYLIMILWVLPVPMLALLGGGSGHSDTISILCGQLFLAMLVVSCYCLLKDQIRNRDYYDKEPDSQDQSGSGAD